MKKKQQDDDVQEENLLLVQALWMLGKSVSSSLKPRSFFQGVH